MTPETIAAQKDRLIKQQIELIELCYTEIPNGEYYTIVRVRR